MAPSWKSYLNHPFGVGFACVVVSAKIRFALGKFVKGKFVKSGKFVNLPCTAPFVIPQMVQKKTSCALRCLMWFKNPLSVSKKLPLKLENQNKNNPPIMSSSLREGGPRRELIPHIVQKKPHVPLGALCGSRKFP